MVDGLPEYHIVQRQVACPWEVKGAVMRRLNEEYRDQCESQIDGIKIRVSNGDWVLILPDPDSPLFRVYAESSSEERAGNLADRYVDIVEKLRLASLF